MKKNILNGLIYAIIYILSRNIFTWEQDILTRAIVEIVVSIALIQLLYMIYKPKYEIISLLGQDDHVIHSVACRLEYFWIFKGLRFGKLFLTDKKLLFLPNNAIEFSKKTLTIERDAIVSVTVSTSFLSHKIKIEEKDKTHQFIMSRFRDRQNVAEALTLLRQMGKVTA